MAVEELTWSRYDGNTRRFGITNVQRVGFIGLSTMGKPMAKRVLQGGYPLTVYDVVRAPVEELAAMGATAAGSLKEVARDSDVVCTIYRTHLTWSRSYSVRIG